MQCQGCRPVVVVAPSCTARRAFEFSGSTDNNARIMIDRWSAGRTQVGGCAGGSAATETLKIAAQGTAVTKGIYFGTSLRGAKRSGIPVGIVTTGRRLG